ncbi:MAG: autotransporter assembly complex protein TamA [Anaerolineae bacterium]
MTRRLLLLALSLFSPLIAWASGISYVVDFEGLDDGSILKTIKSISQLTLLKKHPPPSINALRFRAESDVPEILKVLRAHGYYEAKIDMRIEEIFEQYHVIVMIDPGPAYKLEDYAVHIYGKDVQDPIICLQVQPKTIGIILGKPPYAARLIEAELKALRLLSECGYPLAHIDKRDIIADGATKSVRIRLDIQAGPLCHFGSSTISGEKRVKPQFIETKLKWKRGEVYNSLKVEETQKTLMDTGLFSSVLISHEESLGEDGSLPMRLELTESKYRSVNIGASYQTHWGPGITFGWENRNVGGLGRKLSLQGDVTKKNHSGIATYSIPDFRRLGQDLLWQAQAAHEAILAYSQRSYSFANRLDRKVGRRFSLSVGGKLERLYVTASVDNGNFWLVEVPLYVRWSSANSLLNPTKGATLEYRAIPSVNIDKVSQYYLIQELIQSSYWSVVKSEVLVLAQKITLGSILSNSLHAVPLSKRFLGGSEEELRGYHYRSVSPLEEHKKPAGGRSAIYYTFEMRLRVSKTLGLVPFYDMGKVQKEQIQTFKGKWFKSVGLGLRYFSFIGPLRLDIGFPLDRRKELDSPYRVLVSIGQMF